jgi:hypothetical protein
MKLRGKISLYLQVSCVILLTVFSLKSFAQNGFDWRSRIDRIVEQADSLSLKSQQFFYANRLTEDNKLVRETWYYTMKDDEVIIFEVRYPKDTNTVSETYYLDHGRLICMEHYESSKNVPASEEIQWGQVLFFDNHYLKQYVSIGQQPKKGFSNLDLRMNSLQNFYKRYAELEKNRWH